MENVEELIGGMVEGAGENWILRRREQRSAISSQHSATSNQQRPASLSWPLPFVLVPTADG